MEEEKIIEIYESYQNGNIEATKKAIKRMTKAEFLTFIEHARSHGEMPYKLRFLVEDR